MPELDDRLEQALQSAARVPDAEPAAITEHVATKRRRRRARRRAGASAAATVALVATATVTVAVLDQPDENGVRVTADGTRPPARQPDDPARARTEIEEVVETPTAAPGEPSPFQVESVAFVSAVEALVDVTYTPPGGPPATYRGIRMAVTEPTGEWDVAAASLCRAPELAGTTEPCRAAYPEVRVSDGAALGPDAYAGAAAPVDRITLDRAEGYVRGPLVTGGGMIRAAGYDRSGETYTFPPSRLVAFDASSGQVSAEVGLEGEIQSQTEGGGARWAVTRERFVDTDRVEYRLKRIDSGSVRSEPIPPGDVPVGPVVAGGDAVWVPVRDGALGFTTSGAQYTKVDLPEQDRRGLTVVGGAAYVTDGGTIRRIDAAARVPGDLVLDTGVEGPLTDLVPAGDSVWALAGSGELLRLDRELTSVDVLPLPPGLQNPSLRAAGDQVLVVGTADLAPTRPDATSVAVETVVLVVEDEVVVRTLVVAGGADVAVALDDAGALVLTSGGDVYRAEMG
jgi:hypothetical protein